MTWATVNWKVLLSILLLTYVKIDRKFNYRVPGLTADICKTKRIIDLEIALMERAVNFT